MDSFSSRILGQIRSSWLIFPGLDDAAILQRILPMAEEWVMMQIVTHHLSEDNQSLFRDAYLSAPDVFDPAEFLSDTLPNLDDLVDRYFLVWSDDFQKNL